MACDVHLFPLTPGDVRSTRHVAMLTIRDVEFGGASVHGDNCLNLDLSLTPNDQPITVRTEQGEKPATLDWLTLSAQIWTTQLPRQQLGRVVIEGGGMPDLGSTRRPPAAWRWVISATDVAVVELLRTMHPDSPLQLSFEVEGLIKVTYSGHLIDVVTVRGESTGLVVEMAKWDRLMKNLGFVVSGPAQALADRVTTEHPSWQPATQVADAARTHYRNGEDYDALRDVLSGLEVLVSAPYNSASWKPLLKALPAQKADGVAELLSGLATYCNKIGHHRDRQPGVDGSLPPQPLDHWETDIIIGAGQFILAYAIRLRTAGLLAVPEPPAAKTPPSQSVAVPQAPGRPATGAIPSGNTP